MMSSYKLMRSFEYPNTPAATSLTHFVMAVRHKVPKARPLERQNIEHRCRVGRFGAFLSGFVLLMMILAQNNSLCRVSVLLGKCKHTHECSALFSARSFDQRRECALFEKFICSAISLCAL